MVDFSSLMSVLTADLDALVNQEQTMNRLRVLNQINDLVVELASEAASWSDLVAVGRGAGFGGSEADNDVKVALVSALLIEVKADGDGQGQEHMRRVIAALIKALRESAANITAAWREHVSSAAPGARGLEAVAKTFAGFPAAADDARELQVVLDQLSAMPRERPSFAAEAQLRALAAQVPELLTKLVGEDPEVLAFADSLARGGAAISQITDAVTEWMQSQGFAGSFKVVAGPPAVPQHD